MSGTIAAECRYCHRAVLVPRLFDEDFDGVLERLAKSSACCQTCGEAHAGTLQSERETERQRIEEGRRRAWEHAFVGTVGRKYAACSFDTFDPQTPSQRATLAVVREFATAPRGMLYLHGRPGVGKTHLGVALYREAAQGRDPNRFRSGFQGVEYHTVPELLLRLRSQMGAETSEEEALEPLVTARLLVLDDFGAEKVTDWVRQAFYVIVSRRERDELPTVFTSNLSLGEVEARVGDERITSRIAGAARIVRIEGADGRIARRGRS